MLNFLNPLKIYKILFKKANLNLVYNEESKELYLNSTEKVTLRLGGNFHLVVDGDLDTSVNGEFNLVTNNNRVLIDSHNSTIHFNSRLAKQIRDLPECIEWRKKYSKNNSPNQKCKECNSKDMDDFFKDIMGLFERVEQVENKIGVIK
jgi:hypothetical protein